MKIKGTIQKKITIGLTRKEIEHFKTCHDYLDACNTYQIIFLKIKRELEKNNGEKNN